jgi:uncharacterized protein with HEPN domain
MDSEVNKFILDIKESLNSIEAFLGPNRDFNHYKSTKMLRRAVERELEIIGDALNNILKKDPMIHHEWKAICQPEKQSHSWIRSGR